MNFDIDLLKNNPNTKTTFFLPSPSGVVEAYMVSDTFAVGGTSNFESMFEQGLVKSLAGMVGAGKVVSAGKKLLQMHTMHAKETIASWTGCNKPTFNLDVAFVSIRASDDPRQQVVKFLQGVYPKKVSFGIMGAPFGYNPNVGTSGRFAVTIGKWFTAYEQILTGANFEISKETIETGVPLYVTGNITFESYQQIYDTEVRNFFPGVSG